MASKVVNQLFKLTGIAILRSFDFVVQKFTSNKEIWSDGTFPYSEVLRNNRLVFLSEYDSMNNDKGTPNVKDFFIVETDLKPDDNWKAAPIVLFNYLFKENASRCPETFKIISQLPGCRSAMFSVLEPGKYIPPHRGIYSGIYRCLLTLRVEPGADCWIRVRDKKMYFKEGECIVFDETLEHEVMNASMYPRVVLFLDFYRKLPFPLNILNDIVFRLLRKSPFVMNILKAHGKLETTSIEKFNPSEAILE